MNEPVTSQPALRRLQPWRLLLAIAVAMLLLFLLMRAVNWQEAITYLRSAHLGWVLAAMVALLVNNVAKALRWRRLFPADVATPSRSESFGALMAGQLINFVVPFRSGDVSRAYFMGRQRGSSTASAAGTIGAEKLIDIVILGGLLLVVAPYFVLPDWLQAGLPGVLVVSLVAFLIWLLIIMALPWLQRQLQTFNYGGSTVKLAQTQLARLLNGFVALRQRQNVVSILFWSALTWMAAIVASLFLLISLDLPGGLPLAILALVFIQGGVSVPVAPGHIGVFEWLAVLALGLGGIAPEPALAFGLLAHIAVILIPLLAGLPWLLRRTTSTTTQ